MIPVEHVRVAGVIVAALFAAYGIVRYRHRGWSKFDLLLSISIASGVAVVSVFPQIGEIFVELLGLQNRAFALLSAANLILFGLFLYLLSQVRAANRRGGQIVTALAARRYAEQHHSSGEGRSCGVLVVIPAYNEAGSIRGVVSRIPERVLRREVKTMVVEDGSTDGTEAVALAEGLPVAAHVINLGQGDALRTGFEIALLEGAEIVINLDADGQYRPEEIERLVEPILDGEADFVLGSRFLGYYEEAGSIRHVGVVFFSKLLSMLTSVRITDCTNGFRAIRCSKLAKLDLREDRFNATEIILEALRNGLRFKEVPVTMLRRADGESKKPRRLAYPMGVFRVIIQTWLR